MKSRSRSRRWLVLLGAVSFLALAEVWTRISYAMEGKVARHGVASVDFEWQWVADRLASGDSTAAELPGSARYDPELGWISRPNQYLGGVRTNSAGMRSTREFTHERASGTPRLVLVGDSYTFGFNVEDEHAFHEVLSREYLQGWEVLNLAVPGYGPDQALLRYERDGAPYAPDIVVFGFYLRGFFRLFDGFRSYAKPCFVLEDDGSLDLRSVPVVEPRALLEDYRSGRKQVAGLGHSYFLGSFSRRVTQALERKRIAAEASSWKLMAALLERFHDRARADGAVPLLLILPPGLDGRAEWEGSVYADLDRLAREAAARLGMPCLSLGEVFLDELGGEPLFQAREAGGHLSTRGNRVVAERLGQALRELPDAPPIPRRP